MQLYVFELVFLSTAVNNFSVLSYLKNNYFTEWITCYFWDYTLIKLGCLFQLWLFQLFSNKFFVEFFFKCQKKIPQAQWQVYAMMVCGKRRRSKRVTQCRVTKDKDVWRKTDSIWYKVMGVLVKFEWETKSSVFLDWFMW